MNDNNFLYALLAEGAAEKAVLDVLIEHKLLKFNIEDIFKEQVLRIRSARSFQRLLNQGLGDKQLVIYRVLDSKKENFKLSKAYMRKVKEINDLYTTPEIEMIFIVYHDDWDKYSRKKSVLKPSEFVDEAKYGDVSSIKHYDDVYKFWNEKPRDLVDAIKKYQSLSKNNFDNTLASILQ